MIYELELKHLDNIYVYYEYGEELLVMEKNKEYLLIYDFNNNLHKINDYDETELEKIDISQLSVHGKNKIIWCLNNFEKDKYLKF